MSSNERGAPMAGQLRREGDLNVGKQMNTRPITVSDETDPAAGKRACRHRSVPLRRLLSWLLATCIGAAISVAAQPAPSGSRGELLYSTHCVSCHTTQVHWRDKKLATDWTGLKAQVFRWQSNTGLGWSDDDVVAVARYLSELYYRFPAPGTPIAQQRPLSRASTR
jgi:cytochrome c553